MKIDEALSLYETPALLAHALGCSITAVYRWKNAGHIPEKQQLKLQIATNGALMADDFSANKTVQRQPVTAQLDAELINKAELIGTGNRAEGIRIALSAYQVDLSQQHNEEFF